MSTPQLERLHEHCYRLRLFQVAQELTARLEQAAKRNTVHLSIRMQFWIGCRCVLPLPNRSR